MNVSFDKQNLPTTVALLASIVILLASLVFAVWPKDNGLAEINKMKSGATTTDFKAQLAKKQIVSMMDTALKQTWNGNANDIGPAAYSNLNSLATANKVTIVNFRPQRPVDSGDLTQIPFVVNVTGKYVNVVDFVHQIETTPTKLAVELLQIGASDESTDAVAGTIGVEAYVVNKVPVPSKSTPSIVKPAHPLAPSSTTISAHVKNAPVGGINGR